MPRRKRRLQLLLIAVAALVALVVVGLAFEQYWTTIGYVQVWPGGILRVVDSTILLGRDCTAIVADTSPERAEAIATGLANITRERPSTHDSWAQSLKSFDITLEAVQLQRFDGKYYYADAIFRTPDKALRLDMMPSDAIALALRMGAPIYVKASLLAEVGRDIC